MPRYAHTETGAALDPAEATSAQAYRARFAQDVSAGWTVDEVPANVAHGARVVNGEWVNPPSVNAVPKPKLLSKLEFKRLCVSAGGMTGEMYVACNENPLFKEFWLDFQLAQEISRDDEDVNQGLVAMASAGYLPNGAAAVIAAWPVM